MGADMAGVAVAALAVCGAAIPDKIKLQPKRHDTRWKESARLWVALVGNPSSMKSPIMSAAAEPLRQINATLVREYVEERARYDQLPTDEKKEAQPPKCTQVLLQDATIEATQDVLKDNPNGVLCYQDELSGFFGAMEKYTGGRGAQKDRTFWLEAYNGGSYAVNRIGRGVVFIENLSVSLLGGIQPEPIRKIADGSTDDGLLRRLLPVVLKAPVLGRDEEASPAVEEYATLIGRLHNLEGPRFGGIFRFDNGAQAYRQELERKHLELSQSLEVTNPKLAAHIGKYNGIFARLCIIWHCVESEPGLLPGAIQEKTARRVGAFLHGFLLQHAFAFYAGVLGLSNAQDELTAVAGHILAHKLDRLTNRDVQRGTRTMRALDRREFESILDQLDAMGWVTRVRQAGAEEAERRARDRKLISDYFAASE